MAIFEVFHTLAGERLNGHRITDNGDRTPYVILYSVQCCYICSALDRQNWLRVDTAAIAILKRCCLSAHPVRRHN